MIGVIIILAFVIVELLYNLSKKNPFDRVLWHREYSISPSLDRFHCNQAIRFTKHANIDSLHKAIFDAVYRLHHSEWDYRKLSLSFDNFVPWNMIANGFTPFHFSTISFYDVNPDAFRCIDYQYLPCEELILPHNLTSIRLDVDRIPSIQKLVISSQQFVPLTVCNVEGNDAIYSNRPLNVSVPSNLLSQYRTDPIWTSLRFIDAEGNVSPITINEYPPLE